MNSDAFQTEILEVAQSAVNYRKWLARLTFPYLGSNPLEFGSGIGDYADEWFLLGCKNITVSEVSKSRLQTLQTKFKNNELVTPVEMDITIPSLNHGVFSAVVSLNVLEHLSDDDSACKSAINLLETNGLFVSFVPAFPALMSRFDVAIGHHRRYTRESASLLLRRNGFEIVQIHYVNFIGYFAWLLGMKFLRIIPSDGPLVKILDKLFIPLSSAIEKRIRPPFGQSLLIVGRKI
jgi:SAM-dependent methyltransferase